MATRRYEQRLRAESVQETRRSILDALATLLREHPSRPVRMEEVARRAGVARSTIYVVFGSRAGLFDALGTDLLETAGQSLLRAVRDSDPRENLRGGLRGGAEMFAAHRDVFRVLFSTAQTDADAVGGAVARMEAVRAEGMMRLARRLADAGLLRDDIDVERAAHVLWLAASFEAFDLLYTGRGLPLDEVARILVDGAERALYRPGFAS